MNNNTQKKNLVNKDYNCPWCGFNFIQMVEYNANIDKQTFKQKKKGIISSQVKCPNCNNFIPTWKIEYTGNIVGRKHIHLR